LYCVQYKIQCFDIIYILLDGVECSYLILFHHMSGEETPSPKYQPLTPSENMCTGVRLSCIACNTLAIWCTLHFIQKSQLVRKKIFAGRCGGHIRKLYFHSFRQPTSSWVSKFISQSCFFYEKETETRFVFYIPLSLQLIYAYFTFPPY